MTLSPIEGAAVTVRGVRGLLVGQWIYVGGGLLTGPLFGWLGNRWRTHRDWTNALAVAVAVCCEPLAQCRRRDRRQLSWRLGDRGRRRFGDGALHRRRNPPLRDALTAQLS
jgi:hypothetical protein